jgi:hypothetical protein
MADREPDAMLHEYNNTTGKLVKELQFTCLRVVLNPKIDPPFLSLVT